MIKIRWKCVSCGWDGREPTKRGHVRLCPACQAWVQEYIDESDEHPRVYDPDDGRDDAQRD